MLREAGVIGERRGGARGGPRRRLKIPRPGLGAIAVIAGLVAATDAKALWGDRIEVFVAQARTHDDNVFRISGQSDPVAVLGTSSKGDTYYTSTLGLNFDLAVSRQRFLGGASWDDQRYERFSVLDFTARNARAIWQWQAGNRISGELGHTEKTALASLANVQSGVQSSTPNPVETQRTYLNTVQTMTSRWQLRADLARLDQSNEVPALQVNDIRRDDLDLTVSHVTPAGNRIGLGLQFADGDLPNPSSVMGAAIENDYRQSGVRLVTEWTITGKSRLGARVGWVDRRYEQLPQRDFDGGTFHAEYDWWPTGKLAVAVAAQRDISTTEEINVGFVLVEGVALRPALRLSEKITLSAALEYSEREYLGDPGLVLGTVAPRTDRVRFTGLAASWRPARPLAFDVALRRETRSSTDPLGDYATNLFGVTARLSF